MTSPRRGAAPHADRATLTLDPVTENIPRARHFVDDALPDACWADDVTLLVSELASNAVRHAKSPFTVAVGCDGAIVRVDVTDDSVDLPVARVPSVDAVTGRGLMIVEALANRWGVEPSDSGKTVWFEIDCRNAPAPL
jgi:anti-sigma regulatory factor (Ser/Thr protein kinase)